MHDLILRVDLHGKAIGRVSTMWDEPTLPRRFFTESQYRCPDVVKLAPASISTRRMSFPSQTAEARIIPTAACADGLLDIERASACRLGLPVTADTSSEVR
jgi:hypothetical protein